MRTLFITIVAFNVTFGAAWGVLVLYATERLGMTAVGFGLTTTAMAIGGLAGTALYGPLERRYSLANIMRVGLLIETFTHLVLAVTTLPAVALVTLTVFGGHAFVWNTTATAERNEATSTSRRSTPPISTCPSSGSTRRTMSCVSVLLPTPVGPTIATDSPGATPNDTPSSTGDCSS